MDDEIKNFVNACYIVSPEACCRIMIFQFHERHPGIVQLAVHLENKLRLYFNEQKAFERAINNLHQQHLPHFSSYVKGTISHTTCCIQTYQDFIHGIFQKKNVEPAPTREETWRRGYLWDSSNRKSFQFPAPPEMLSTRKSWIHKDHNKVSPILHGSPVHTTPKPNVSLATYSLNS